MPRRYRNLLVLVGLLLSMVSIPRDAWAYQTYTLTANRVRVPGPYSDYPPLITTPARSWAAGETHTVTAFLKASAQVKYSGARMLVAARVRCGDDTVGVQTTQNHLGTGGVTVVQLNYIWTAPSSGTYSCYLDGRTEQAGGTHVSTDQITVQGGASNTYLLFSDGNYTDGKKWALENSCATPNRCYSSTESKWDGTIHIGSGMPVGTSEYVLHSLAWIPKSSATYVIARADAQLTVCNYGTGSCPSSRWGPQSLSGSGSSGTYYMVSTQGTCAPVTQEVKSYSISYGEHHKKIFGVLPSIPISSSCARSFVFKLYVSASSSLNPVQVHASSYSIGLAVGG